jgi:hypothetical protein
MRAQALLGPLKSLEEERGAWSAVAHVLMSPISPDPLRQAYVAYNIIVVSRSHVQYGHIPQKR